MRNLIQFFVLGFFLLNINSVNARSTPYLEFIDLTKDIYVSDVKIFNQQNELVGSSDEDGVFWLKNIRKKSILIVKHPNYVQKQVTFNGRNLTIELDLKPAVLKAFKEKYQNYYFSKDEILALKRQELDSSKKDTTEFVIEKPAEFPGGRIEMMKFLAKNIEFPQFALEQNIQGKVYMCFEVSTDGKVENIKILKGVSHSIDMEAYKVVKTMPQWNPGTLNGEPVRSYFTLPINFSLQ